MLASSAPSLPSICSLSPPPLHDGHRRTKEHEVANLARCRLPLTAATSIASVTRSSTITIDYWLLTSHVVIISQSTGGRPIDHRRSHWKLQPTLPVLLVPLLLLLLVLVRVGTSTNLASAIGGCCRSTGTFTAAARLGGTAAGSGGTSYTPLSGGGGGSSCTPPHHCC